MAKADKKSKKDKDAKKLKKAVKEAAKKAVKKVKGKIDKKVKGSGSAKGQSGKKKGPPIFKAPEDFKPHFLELKIGTDKDGLISNTVEAIRYQGKYDPEAPDKKKANLLSYDVPTLVGIIARLSSATYKTNGDKFYPADIAERNAVEKLFDKEGKKIKDDEGKQKVGLVHRASKRLPPNTSFKILLRVGKRSKDDALTVGFKFIKQGVKNEKSGKIKAVELDKKDPAYRALRKASRILPAAFKKVQMPPKPVRGGKKSKKDDDE